MFAVTTSLHESEKQLGKALEISSELDIPYIERTNKNIEQLLIDNTLDGILVVGKNRLTYKYPGGEFFFHPGMAKLRINEILNGKTDQMIKALDLRPGDTVLDCTLGLGSDAIVASFMNKGGRVTGLEQSRIICLIVKKGLAEYTGESDPAILLAMRRINVICDDYNSFLKDMADNSADIIYFDPMFRTPGRKSCAMESMRPLTNNSPLSPEALREAIRVARRRVVVKESKNSPEFDKLGICKISGGKYSPVSYGIIEKGVASICCEYRS
ncbi:MAG: class I SAM-dependent methyltransferase [Bacillota bacterium]